MHTATGELPFFGYNAEEYNPTTGLQYLRARYYDVTDGRFDVRDSFLGSPLEPLSLNRYLYADANPLQKTDPTGQWSFWGAVTSAASAVVNTVKTVASTVVSAAKTVASTVVSAASSAASWVNNNIVKPVASWVNNTIVKPVQQAATNAIAATQRFMGAVYQGASTLYQAADQAWQGATTWLSAQAAAVQAEVYKFICTTADTINSAWESAVDTLSQVDWQKVGQVALIVGGIAVGAVVTVATCGVAGPVVAGLAVAGLTASTALAANDLVTVITGTDPLHEALTDLTGSEQAATGIRIGLDVLTMLTPGAGASGAARAAGQVAGPCG
jgi:RHS repeat-associated protein